MVSRPLPVPKLFRQPRPCSSSGAPSGSGPTYCVRVGGAVGLAEGVAAGDQRDGLLVVHRHAANVSRMSRAEASGSGLPFGPSGLT